MKRSTYVRDSGAAAVFYQNAFDAKLVASYPNPDGTFYHAELDVYGQILALSEAPEGTTAGNNMQFCLHFGAGHEATVGHIYDVLKEGADIVFPLGPCDFSPLMASLIDKFGIYWCIFI